MIYLFFLKVLLVLYLLITAKYVVLLFLCPTCPVTVLSYSYFCCSFLFFAHLLVWFWRTLIFQHLSLRRSLSHCTRDRERLSSVSTGPCSLLYFGILSCYEHFCILSYTSLAMYPAKANVWWKNIFLICDNKISGCLL